MMSALILVFFKKHSAAFLLIAAIFAIGLMVYLKGWSDSTAGMKAAEQKHTINRINDRGKTNAKVEAMDHADVCGVIGGVYRDNKCQ